jgi:hypothetical protein
MPIYLILTEKIFWHLKSRYDEKKCTKFRLLVGEAEHIFFTDLHHILSQTPTEHFRCLLAQSYMSIQVSLHIRLSIFLKQNIRSYQGLLLHFLSFVFSFYVLLVAFLANTLLFHLIL